MMRRTEKPHTNNKRRTLSPEWLKSAKHFAKVSLVLSVHRKYSTLPLLKTVYTLHRSNAR